MAPKRKQDQSTDLVKLERTLVPLIKPHSKWLDIRELKTDKMTKDAQTALAIVVGHRKEVERQRKDITKDLDSAKKKLMSQQRQVLSSLGIDALEPHLRQLVEDRDNVLITAELKKAEQRARRLEKKGADEAADDVRRQAVEEPALEKHSGSGTRREWRAEVLDLKALCAAIGAGQVSVDYVEANMSMLAVLVKSKKTENVGIPGVRGVLKSVVVVGR